jgi:hypothetical protein
LSIGPRSGSVNSMPRKPLLRAAAQPASREPS